MYDPIGIGIKIKSTKKNGNETNRTLRDRCDANEFTNVLQHVIAKMDHGRRSVTHANGQ